MLHSTGVKINHKCLFLYSCRSSPACKPQPSLRRVILSSAWSAPLYNILPHYLINGTIFEKKKVTEHKKCVLIFSTTFASYISHTYLLTYLLHGAESFLRS